MFKNPFSFTGRIRRKEYALSILIYLFSYLAIGGTVFGLVASVGTSASILLVLFIPLFWFGLAQGVKRSHDLNNSGWFILIPFYCLWLLFAEGTVGDNEHGTDPKATEEVAQVA